MYQLKTNVAFINTAAIHRIVAKIRLILMDSFSVDSFSVRFSVQPSLPTECISSFLVQSLHIMAYVYGPISGLRGDNRLWTVDTRCSCHSKLVLWRIALPPKPDHPSPDNRRAEQLLHLRRSLPDHLPLPWPRSLP